MSARQDKRTGKWFYRVRVRGVDGTIGRLYRSPFESKREAEEAEALAITEWKQGTAVIRKRLSGGHSQAV